jgi:hypothetical protein
MDAKLRAVHPDDEVTGDRKPSPPTFQAEWTAHRDHAARDRRAREVETAPIMKTATKTASTAGQAEQRRHHQVPEFINEGERAAASTPVT